jgi:hypothetical protein
MDCFKNVVELVEAVALWLFVLLVIWSIACYIRGGR